MCFLSLYHYSIISSQSVSRMGSCYNFICELENEDEENPLSVAALSVNDQRKLLSVHLLPFNKDKKEAWTGSIGNLWANKCENDLISWVYREFCSLSSFIVVAWLLMEFKYI